MNNKIKNQDTEILAKISKFLDNIGEGDFSQKIKFTKKEIEAHGELVESANYAGQVLHEMTQNLDKVSTGDYTADISPRGENDTLGTALQRMTTILREASQVAEKLADGDTSVKVKEQGPNDLLAQSMNRMVDTLNNVSQQANIISTGDYTADISPRGENDTLGTALQRMTTILREVSQVAEKVADGDYSVSIEQRGPSDLMAKSMTRMIRQLSSVTTENAKKIWISNGLTGIYDVTLGKTDVQKIAQGVCNYLAAYLEAQILTFYVMEDENLRLMGSYAYNKRKNKGETIEIGEGLVGQAALERKTIMITGIPKNYTRIHSSIGDAYPRNIIVIPFAVGKSLYGVIEIGSFKDLTEDKVALLESLKEPVAVVIQSVLEQSKTKELLEETQRQSEELQSVQEELQSTNENLEEQTQQLKASEEELKTQSEELRSSNEELLEKSNALEIQKKDVENAREDLEIKSKDLAQASKYKSEFLANMSHELRTPLNSFLLLSKGLSNNKKGNLDEEQLEDLNIIYEGGSDLLRLINDIMDLSKVEAGKMDVDIIEVNLNTTCNNITGQFNPPAKSKAFTFTVEREKQVPETLKTDPQRLEQILKNFLSNSFKFTENGSVQLNIHMPAPSTRFLYSSLSPKSAIAFSVIDTGIGIPADKLRDIFEAFQQEDGSTGRKYGGTGLGLVISKELARILGGEIQLTSKVGEGSVFTLYLPLNGETRPEHEKTDIKSDVQSVSEIPIEVEPDSIEQFIPDDRNYTGKDDNSILIIEDDATFAKTLLKIVRKRGYKGLVAGDGKNGLYLALEYEPKGVFLDMGLPDMDGKLVLEQLKFHLKTKNIPVHIISGKEQDIDSLQDGAIGFLHKPVKEKDINRVISDMQEIASADIKNILIVEDDKACQRGIQRFISNKGIQVECVDNGKAAVKKISSGNFDCVILDIGLPDISGFDVLQKISSDSSIIMPPIIVYTGMEISRKQRNKLQKYAATIVLKDSGSSDKQLDEALLFMHSVAKKLNPRKQKTIYNNQDEAELLLNRKVLLVDDDIRNTFALSKRLQEAGLIVYEADNGKSALNKLKELDDIELVIMDIMMPIMDGYEAMRRIRKSKQYKKVPIIALTAKAMKEDREKCIAAGATDYLTKPVDFDKLVAMLKVWLYKK
jgi:CheY-like chemotaxis protein